MFRLHFMMFYATYFPKPVLTNLELKKKKNTQLKNTSWQLTQSHAAGATCRFKAAGRCIKLSVACPTNSRPLFDKH